MKYKLTQNSTFKKIFSWLSYYLANAYVTITWRKDQALLGNQHARRLVSITTSFAFSKSDALTEYHAIESLLCFLLPEFLSLNSTV